MTAWTAMTWIKFVDPKDGIVLEKNLPNNLFWGGVLVGGWTNPFEKYDRQIGENLPKVRGEHEKIQTAS